MIEKVETVFYAVAGARRKGCGRAAAAMQGSGESVLRWIGGGEKDQDGVVRLAPIQGGMGVFEEPAMGAHALAGACY